MWIRNHVFCLTGCSFLNHLLNLVYYLPSLKPNRNYQFHWHSKLSTLLLPYWYGIRYRCLYLFAFPFLNHHSLVTVFLRQQTCLHDGLSCKSSIENPFDYLSPIPKNHRKRIWLWYLLNDPYLDSFP